LKTERKKLGWRNRVTLNRADLRAAARIIAEMDAEEPHVLTKRGGYKFPAEPARGLHRPLSLTIFNLETACRHWLRANVGDAPPPNASFKVEAGRDGAPPECATFQWWDLGE
jgi:hypothetical protein